MPTADVLLLSHRMDSAQFQRKAAHVLAENVRTLLDARKEDQQTLARWCGHDKSWINKFLNGGRGVTLKDFDKIATFFGLETYQLFQPGIARLTERRSGIDRRTAQERRVGHTLRLLSSLRTELNKVPKFASLAHPQVLQSGPEGLPEPVQRIMADAQRRIADYLRTHPVETAAPRKRAATNTTPHRGKPAGPAPKR